jgi:regulator of sigma D
MEAAFTGLTWRVIKEEASKVWPSLAAYAQRALNFEARQVVSETECIGGAWL